MKKDWQIIQPDIQSVENLGNILNCHRITATLLINRKIETAAKAWKFLNPSLKNIRSPFSIKDMDTAVRRIYKAITNGEKILIFGDYDVDGITSTSILLDFLQNSAAEVDYYIPHRTKEGYSLQTNHISDHAIPNHINLIITVDCGSTSHDAVKMAQESGIDVIITDHHIIPTKVPQAFAVVNPKRHDCTAGFENLAGVGVVFFVIVCLRKFMRDMNFWQDRPEPNLKSLCDLVALGTLADSVPLMDENRIFTSIGVQMIKQENNRPGIRALLKLCHIKKAYINSEDILFKIAPRLNAPGRIEHGKLSVEILIANRLNNAVQLATTLNDLNTLRKKIEDKILNDIQAYLAENPGELDKNSLVLSAADWHEGVLGIVAAKLVDHYFRPVVLITTKNGVGKGSARSIPGYNLYEGLSACSNDLVHFGGHSMASGLTIKLKNIERFKTNFDNAVAASTKPAHFTPKLSIDGELAFDDISDRLIDEIESLAPFGQGNPEPLFMAKNVEVFSSKIVGKNHRSMLLKQPGGKMPKIFNAIHFNAINQTPLKDSFDRMAFRLRWNRWNGQKKVQILVQEISG
ncbi:MAG: single-stranded-DNA-specific exonuclease RecJ [Thermodesulfobacteriota bacterium]|nr:single-stranded-DNA-specific exonuclease RecJ [Thermodesulfobacteriota bacterium]